MKIAATQFSLSTKSLEIFISGCDGACDLLNKSFINDGIYSAKCHNPELWDFNIGLEYNDPILKASLIEKVELFDDLIEFICIMGGEPLLQNKAELIEFITFIQSLNKKVVLFTRFELRSIPKEILQLCFAFKTGSFDYKYIGSKSTLGFILASTNQKITLRSDLNAD